MRLRLLLSLGVVVAACGPPAAFDDDDSYVDHELGVSRQGLTAGEAGGCDTSIVAGLTGQLVAELNCIAPNTMVDFRAPNLMLSGAVQPYLSPGAAAALQAAVNASGTTITLSSAYRSAAQQYLLLKWYNAGQCGIQAAALPGRSNHQSGRAIDVPSYNTWISKLQAQGWTWYGSGDVVHFDFLSAPNLGGSSVLAFQKLWNKNNASKLAEDGEWGPNTEAAMAATPTTGFATFGCGQTLPPTQSGTLKGRVYEVNPGDPGDLSKGIATATVSVGGKTLSVDATGLYTVELPAGTYTVVATASGFANATVSRVVSAGQIVWGSVGLNPQGAPDTLPPEVVLVSPAPGSRVDVAQVTLTGTASDAQGTVAQLTLSVNGAAAVPVQLSGGAFSQAVHLSPGSNALRFVAVDARGNASTTDVALSFATGVDGLVLNLAGALEGASVDATGSDARTVSSRSAADGTFHLDLVPGRYLLRAHSQGHVLGEYTFVIGSEQREQATLTLVPEPVTPSSGGCASAPGLFTFAALVLAVRRARPRRAS